MIPGVVAASGIASGGGGGSGLLDDYTADVWAAYGLRKLFGSYSGPCVRVRRASDDAESDIGFDGSDLDVAALASFVGSSSGFVKTFYDQSGGANHFSQTTSGTQPRIVNAGTFDGVVFFDGSNDELATVTTFGGTATGMTTHLHGQIRATPNSITIWCELSDEGVANAGFSWYDAPAFGVPSVTLGIGPLDNRVVPTFAPVSTYIPNGGVDTARADRTDSNVRSSLRLYKDGALQTATGSQDGALPIFGVPLFIDAAWHIGSRSGSAFSAQLSLSDFIIYDVAQSDADIAAIAGLLV